MNAQDLIYLYNVNVRVAQRNCTDITESEALQTINGSSSMNWILGHMLNSRSNVLTSVNCPRLHPAEDLLYYRATNESAERHGEPLSLQHILQYLEESRTRFNESVEQAWHRAELSSDESQRRHLLFYAFHESYHVGQLGLFRRIVGKEGMIA